MTEHPSDDENSAPRHAGGELVIPVLALVFTIYYFTTIWDSPWTAQVNAILVGSILFVCIAALAVRIARDRITGAIDFNLVDLISPVDLLGTRLAFAALTLIYIIALGYAGFTLSTFAFLATSFMLLHGTRRWLFDIVLAAVMALIGFAVFIIAFETRFPKGPFERLMDMVLP